MPLLRISALHKYYGDHHVLKGIDLSVEEGQVVAIIGRSGSGKSTLLRTLNGLESINDGVKSTASTSTQPAPICAACDRRSAWSFSNSTCSRT
ncbi:ABC-type polar amino acid transport system ATPase subunit [Pseudomonas sp. EB276 TE3739]|nr:ABC-type polar amino acid transport system ATPase subunit [Pseudomonas koreensis]